MTTGFLDRFKKPKAGVELKIPNITVELGDDLKGAITITCQEDFSATEIRGELRCIEKRRNEKWVYDEERKRKVRHVYWDTATLHSDNPTVAGKMHLIPGYKKTFPLGVNIPAGGRASFDGLEGSVTWFVKGVIAVDDRPDVTSDTIELQVVKPTGPIASRKRVEMIPCEYCETLMPETTSFCPNCSAPRKV